MSRRPIYVRETCRGDGSDPLITLTMTPTGVDNGPHTGIALARQVSATGDANQWIYTHDNGAAGYPVRITVSANSQAGVGGHSSGTANSPSSNSLIAELSIATWFHIGFRTDGSLTATNYPLYTSTVENERHPIAEIGSYFSQTDGSGALITSSGMMQYLLNRTDLARGWNGDIVYVVLWNRRLSLPEIQTAIRNGPLTIKNGLIFCWANGRDYGPYRHKMTTTSLVTRGELPGGRILLGYEEI